MATYTITLPNPVPKIVDALGYDRGNIFILFKIAGVIYTIEFSTEIRANTALNVGRNAWVVVTSGGYEVYRWRYTSATGIVTLIAEEPMRGTMHVCVIGRESDWDGELDLAAVVEKDGAIPVRRANSVLPSPGPGGHPAQYPDTNFDSIYMDALYAFPFDLPVWSIRPNWRDGILERLEWLTDILPSASGVEQRRALRLSPRRSMEITINPTGDERTFADLLLHHQGSSEWYVPLWWDKARLSADVAVEAARVNFDNTYREHGNGGLALLYFDTWNWEVISIESQDANGLNLDVPLEFAWKKGTVVYPLRQARLSDDTALDALTSRVGEAVLLWTMTQANEWPAIAPADLIFEDMPVLTTAPNRSQTLTLGHVRLSTDRDNQVGIPYRVDPVGRAFQVQSHSWMKVGRQAQAEFRSFLYWLRGQQRALWLPSFNEDIVTARASAINSLSLDVRKIGMGYSGGVVSGRDVVQVGPTVGRITALGAPQAAGEERLRIGAGLTAAVPAGRPGSFLSAARLNQDAVELMHHADSDGALECSTSFKTFANSRDAAGPIHYPIPQTNRNILACGQSPLAWQLPCAPGSVGATCSCVNEAISTYDVRGDPATIYNIAFRVRGVVERLNVVGGSVVAGSGGMCKEGPYTLPAGGWQPYELHVQDPPADFVFNHSAGASSVVAVDYTVTIPVRGGTRLTFTATASDGQQLRPLGITAVDNDIKYPIIVYQPFDGQFLQLDGELPK